MEGTTEVVLLLTNVTEIKTYKSRDKEVSYKIGLLKILASHNGVYEI